MAALRVGERRSLDQSTHLEGIVVKDRRLQVLALRRGLPELPPQPAQEAHGCLIRHAPAGYIDSRRR